MVQLLSLKHSATTSDVIYYDRSRMSNKYNALLKHGEPYPGWGKPDKQIHNLGFWYGWKDSPIKTFEEFSKTELNEWAVKFNL